MSKKTSKNQKTCKDQSKVIEKSVKVTARKCGEFSNPKE